MGQWEPTLHVNITDLQALVDKYSKLKRHL